LIGDGKNVFAGRLRERRDGKIWICTPQGVYVADPETLTIAKFPQISSGTDIAETKDGSVVSASGESVYYVDAKTGETTQFTHDQINSKSNFDQFSSSVTVDHLDRIWIGTITSLELFNPHEKAFTHYHQNPRIRTYRRILMESFYWDATTGSICSTLKIVTRFTN
jgi:streptogramin lyase